MKNTNLKLNKTKLVARLMLVVILVVGLLNLTGCVKSQLKKGEYYEQDYCRYCSTSLRVSSNTRKFDIDNVELQLSIGLHKKEYSLFDWLTKDTERLLSQKEDDYQASEYDKNIYYVVYLSCAGWEKLVDDTILEDAYILKEIPYVESFEGGVYNYTVMPYFAKIFYNNCETITIPRDFFLQEEYNYFYLGVRLVEKINDENQKYGTFAMEESLLEISFALNDGIVSIGFPYIEE